MKDVIVLAEGYLEEGKLEQARDLLIEELKQKGSMADVHNLLGVAYHLSGQFSNAVTELEHAIELNPRFTEALLNLTILYNDLGLYEKAEGVYMTISSLKKGRPELDVYLKGKMANVFAQSGHMYVELREFEEAILAYKKSNSLRDGMLDVKLALADCYLRTGQVVLAIGELEEALLVNAQFAGVYELLGLAYWEVGNRERAISTWERCLRIDEKNASAKAYLSLARPK